MLFSWSLLWQEEDWPGWFQIITMMWRHWVCVFKKNFFFAVKVIGKEYTFNNKKTLRRSQKWHWAETCSLVHSVANSTIYEKKLVYFGSQSGPTLRGWSRWCLCSWQSPEGYGASMTWWETMSLCVCFLPSLSLLKSAVFNSETSTLMILLILITSQKPHLEHLNWIKFSSS
jgi:hypothetical protein